MHSLTSILLVLLSRIISAQVFHQSGLTLTFSPDGLPCRTVRNATDDSGVSFFVDSSQDVASALCIDLDSMFSRNNSIQTGNTNNYYIFDDPSYANYTPKPARASVNWTSYGGDHFQRSANYTNIWYYQQNATGSTGEGQYAALQVIAYPNTGCSYATHSTPPLVAYDYSCQTGSEGRCNVDHSGIKSVQILALNRSNVGSCYEFQSYPSGGQRAHELAGLTISVLGTVLFVLATLA